MAKIALLIGISDYQLGFDPLPGTQTDIREMQRVLEHPQMGGFDQVDVLPNPDTGGMQLAIEKLLADCKKDDLVLLYFSGHGFRDEYGSLYFVTHTTEKRPSTGIYTATAMPASMVQGWMSRSSCKRLVLVLDCCYSGAFAEGMKAKAANVPIDIAAQLGGKGRVVLTSSTNTQVSLEKKGAAVYTRYLVEGIESGAADTDNNGKITVDELHQYAKRKVQETAPAMTPEIFAVKEGYTIVLANAPLGDPKLEYRKEVERVAQERNGQLSRIVFRALDEKCKQLKLSVEEAKAIRVQVLQPFRDFKEKQQQYERELRNAIRKEFPLSEATYADLQYLQHILGLRDEDVAAIKAEGCPEPTVLQLGSIPLKPVEKVSLMPAQDDDTEALETQAKRIQQLLKELETALGVEKQGSDINAQDCYELGVAKYRAGDFQGAIADFDQAIMLNPDYAAAYFCRGYAHYDLDEAEAAIQDFDQAITLNLDAAAAYFWRGRVRNDLDEAEAAIQDFDQAIALNPDDPDAYGWRGVVRLRLGETQAAIADFDQAITLNPDDANTYCWRGCVRYDLNEAEAAIQDFDQAIALNPDYADAYFERGRVRYGLGEAEIAIQDFDQAITLNPDDANTYCWRGRVRCDLDEMEAAIQDFDQAITLNPDYAGAYSWRGYAHYELDETQAAIEDYQEVANLYKQQGDTENYQYVLNQIKQLQPWWKKIFDKLDTYLRLKDDFDDEY